MSLAAYLAEPLETTVLVVVCPGRRAPAALLEAAVRAAGLVIDAAPAPNDRARASGSPIGSRQRPSVSPPRRWTCSRSTSVRTSPVSTACSPRSSPRFRPPGPSTRPSFAPFLGAAGGVAPWDLTDAIDARDVPAAIAALSRLVGPGERNPFQVLALLHRHFGAMLRLDGSGITDEDSAAAATGLKPYPAKKALASAHRLGHAGIVRDFAARPGRHGPSAASRAGATSSSSRSSSPGSPDRRPAGRWRARRAGPGPGERGASGSDPAELLELATRLARESGQLLVEASRHRLDRLALADTARRKSSTTDLGTEADRASEQLIVGGIKKARPADGLARRGGQ